MRFTLILSFLLVCSGPVVMANASFAPTSLQKSEAGMWVYEKVVEIPGSDKVVLYERAKKWILSNVKSVDQNSLTDDPTHEALITNVTLDLGKLWTLYSESAINFKLVIDFKDNKIRISAKSFSYHALGTGPNFEVKNSPLETYRDSKVLINRVDDRIDETFPAFIQSLEAGIKNSSSKDW